MNFLLKTFHLPAMVGVAIHTLLGLTAAVFLVMLCGAFLQRMMARGDFRQKISAKKHILIAATALILTVGLWLLLFALDGVFFPQTEPEVFGAVRPGPY